MTSSLRDWAKHLIALYEVGPPNNEFLAEAIAEEIADAEAAARAEERERCAKLVERWNLGTLAAAIRCGFAVDEDIREGKP